jgi:hypothetical protein
MRAFGSELPKEEEEETIPMIHTILEYGRPGGRIWAGLRELPVFGSGGLFFWR